MKPPPDTVAQYEKGLQLSNQQENSFNLTRKGQIQTLTTGFRYVTISRYFLQSDERLFVSNIISIFEYLQMGCMLYSGFSPAAAVSAAAVRRRAPAMLVFHRQ